MKQVKLFLIILCPVIGMASAVRADEVGHTAGMFTVGIHGDATYKLPIVVPPGVAGMQPDLALVYNSNAGNGQLGVGWSLAGLSAITRCPATVAQDGFAGAVRNQVSDRFCLDGHRLMKVSGTYGAHDSRYRTEIETYQDVIAYDNNADGQIDQFLVRDKTGMTRHYGGSEQSRIEAQGQSAIATWMVNRVSDKFGNYLLFGYVKETGSNQRGEFWVDFIDYYNANDQRIGQVRFDYTGPTRIDRNFGYSYGGSKVALGSLLRGIEVYGHDGSASLTLARQYNLAYQTNVANGLSQLTEVQQCDGSGTHCLRPTRFNYLQGENGFEANSLTTLSSYISNQFLDVNGDGRIDQVYEWNYRWTIRLSGQDTTTHITAIDSHNQAHETEHTRVLDYNGDGRQDLLVANVVTGRWEILESTGTGFVVRDTGRQHHDAHLREYLVMDLDGDALPEIIYKRDGWLEFMRNEGGSYSAPVLTDLKINDAQILTPLEYDGDGQPDIVVNMTGCSPGGPPTGPDDPIDPPGNPGPPIHPRSQAETVPVSRGTTHCSETAGILTWSAAENNLVPLPMSGMTDTANIGGENRYSKLLDFNADGLTDLAVAPLSNQDPWRFYVNKGRNWQLVWTGHNGNYRHLATIFDYDGDGRQELWQPNNNRWYRLRPDVSEDAVSFTVINTLPFNDRSFFMDWTGDGLGDLIIAHDGSYHVRAHRGSKRGLLKSVETGLGVDTQLAYVALSDIGADVVYAGETGSPVFPDRHFRAPLYLVRSVAADSGLLSPSGTDIKVTTNYTYYGAKLNQHGRGFLGFSKIEAHNVNSEIVTRNEHSQDFPFIGMISRAQQWTPDVVIRGLDWEDIEDDFAPCTPASGPCTQPRSTAGQTQGGKGAGSVTQQRNTVVPGEKLAETVNTLALRSFDVGEEGARYFPFVAVATEKQFKYYSTAVIRRTVTTTAYDEYGNATSVIVTVDDGADSQLHRVSTTNTYQNWTDSRWCLGRLMTTAVTHERADYGSGGSLSINRESSFAYDTSTCQLIRETIEPESAEWRLQTDYGHDIFGNRNVVTMSGPGVAARVSTTQYDNFGQYPLSVRNALDHEIVSTWGYAQGHRLATTDINGFSQTNQYDELGRLTRKSTRQNAVWSEFHSEWCSESVCEMSNAVFRIVTTSSAVAAGENIERIVEYDQLGREVLSQNRGFDGSFAYKKTLYDAIGRVHAVSLPHFADDPVCWTVSQYDNIGRVATEYRPAETQDCHNLGAGAPDPADYQQVAAAYGNNTEFDYDGLATTVIDAQGRQITRRRNVMGRLISVSEYDDDHQLLETVYDYDAQGNTAWVRDAAGNISLMEYNTRGFKVSMTDPDLGYWQYEHNTFGELIRQQDANNAVTLIAYDDLGRMTHRSTVEGSSNWFFDGAQFADDPDYHGASLGKVTRVEGPDGYQQVFRYEGDHGELTQLAERLDSNWHCTDFQYDDQGRNWSKLVPGMGNADACVAANRLQLVTDFNEYGYPYLVREYRDQTYRDTFWRATAMNASGQVTEEKTHHDTVTTSRHYDLATGALLSTTAGPNGAIQNQGFEWDAVGNLTARTDFNQGRTERFAYDGLYRLNQVSQAQSVDGGGAPVAANRYDAVGNLVCKDATGINREGCSSGFHGFTYGSGNTSADGDAGPHAVTGVSNGPDRRVYDYDNNGNLIRVSSNSLERNVTWYSFNRPQKIINKDDSAEFWYRPTDYSRWKQVSRRDSQTTTTYYSAGLYQRKIRAGQPDEHIYSISAGNRVIGQIKRYGDVVIDNDEQYLHQDHLGSIVAVSNTAGDVIELMSYDAWGKRRSVTDWTAPGPQNFLYALSIQHGFTGHEHIDHLGLINMNGRVYDFETGRFLSADPFIQYPGSTQGLNRYSYVQNNPLSHTDPSGFFIKGLLAKVAGKIIAVMTGQHWLGYLVQGYLSSGRNLKAMTVGLVLGTALGQTLYTGYQYFQSGSATRKRGGRFVNGALRAMHDHARDVLASFTQDYLINTASRIAFSIKTASVSGTAPVGGGDKGGGGTNGADSDSFENATKIEFEAELGLKIKQWLEIGVRNDGRFFAKAGDKTVSMELNASGSLVFRAGQSSTEIQIHPKDFDKLAKRVHAKFNIDLAMIGGSLSLDQSGQVKWKAYLKSSGWMGKLGIRGKAGFSGTFDPSRKILESPFGKAGYQYRRGTTEHVDRCLKSDFTLEGC